MTADGEGYAFSTKAKRLELDVMDRWELLHHADFILRGRSTRGWG